ncbi:nitrate- and nitrite sensing domain-containing protein [Actinospica sp. MGRD01-02]|uniref:histidine kinase n=1 Tax=Actinospica acidithermotolerans TaxID=2828514 RepID=A0A941EAY7_9ACTN|nr:nitrate- and nitrite sensing domain-containing protein [Actinospica acidithermotolerans]MBR7827092.1 nitrate- and nitrite sensing domain-containing protein [Actinospica acidithermotolerans]
MTTQTTPSTSDFPVEQRRSRRAAHRRPVEPPQAPVRQSRPRRRFRFAPRTVRARIVSLLALPVVSLTALWGIAAVNTISAAYNQSQLKTLDSSVAAPLDNTVTALQEERSEAVSYLAVTGAAPTTLNARISASRDEEAMLRLGVNQSAAAAADLDPQLPIRLTTTMKAMDALSAIRTGIIGHSLSVSSADNAYATAIADALNVQATLATISGASSTAQAALNLSEAREQLALQDALLGGMHNSGALSGAAYPAFVGAVYAERSYLRQAAMSVADPTATITGQSLTALQNAVIVAGPGQNADNAAPARAWDSLAPTVLADLDSASRTAATPASENPYSRLLTTGSGFGVLLGLFALIVSLVISVGIGRRLVTDLVGLRDYALDLAGRRLPETMAKLRAGQNVVPQQQAPPLDPRAGELGEVAEALAVASQAAMQAAVERAELVSGVSGVFLNLARRSQVLVHRQLGLLDAMERRIEEPDHLEDLFRLDHLATRMRRHAEGLIILSGATPGRAWRHPVDLTDVVRAAAAEAEDYPRVEVRRMPRARVLGPVVADLTHLLAELIENATSFSPPHTRVVVGGEPVGSGFAIEIEDRGLGMSPEALREANRRIGESSGDDLFDSDRLGLFVVSRLARRHEVRVSLCASAYGGITAVVLIPSSVMQSPGESDEQPTALDEPGGGQRIGGPRGVAPAGGLAASVITAATAPALVPPQPTAESARVPHTNGHSRVSGTVKPRNFDGLGDSIAPPADSGIELGPDGLPRRVRQANLAPQLRAAPTPPKPDDPMAEPAAGEDSGDPRPPRSPEQYRATMSAFQRGFTRGRAEGPADDQPSAPDAAADERDARGEDTR